MISASGHLLLVDFGLSKVVAPPDAAARLSGRTGEENTTKEGSGSAAERALEVARKVLPLRDVADVDIIVSGDVDGGAMDAAGLGLGAAGHGCSDMAGADVPDVHVLLVDPDCVSPCAHRLRELYVKLPVVHSVDDAAETLGALQVARPYVFTHGPGETGESGR